MLILYLIQISIRINWMIGIWWMWFVYLLQIRKDYYEDKVTAGPQSRVLEGLTWEEAQKLQVGIPEEHPSFLNTQANQSVRIDIIRIFQMHGFNKKFIMTSCLRLLLMFDHTVSSFLKISFDCLMKFYMQQWLGKVNEEYKIGEN